MDTYPAGAVSSTCSSGTYTNAAYNAMDGARTRPIIYMGVYSAAQTQSDTPYYGYKLYQADYAQFIMIPEANYAALGQLKISVHIDWLGTEYPDIAKSYTVNVYNN